MPFFHRLDDGLQCCTARRNVFEQNSVGKAQAFAYYIVDTQRRKHPILHRVVLQHVLIKDKIFVAVATVAVDDDSKNIHNCVAMPIERRAAERQSAAQFAVRPLVAKVGKRMVRIIP